MKLTGKSLFPASNLRWTTLKVRQTSQEEHERHRSASYTQAMSMISSLDSWQFDKTRPKIYVLLRVWFNSFNPLLFPWRSGPFGTCRLQMPSRAHEDFLGHWADQTNYHRSCQVHGTEWCQREVSWKTAFAAMASHKQKRIAVVLSEWLATTETSGTTSCFKYLRILWFAGFVVLAREERGCFHVKLRSMT